MGSLFSSLIYYYYYYYMSFFRRFFSFELRWLNESPLVMVASSETLAIIFLPLFLHFFLHNSPYLLCTYYLTCMHVLVLDIIDEDILVLLLMGFWLMKPSFSLPLYTTLLKGILLVILLFPRGIICMSNNLTSTFRNHFR